MNLRLVTLTGADDGSDPNELVRLSEKYPFVEWGILVSAKQMGSTRFPSSSWMRGLAAAVQGKNIGLAVHVCGRWVRDIISGRFPKDLAELPMPWDNVKRFQLNFHAEKHDFNNDIIRVLEEQPFEGRQIIFQYDSVNEDDIEELPLCKWNGNAPLFDMSHGAGVLPSNWPKASSSPGYVFYGYAGGLGQDCLPAQLDPISAAAEDKPFWIDMETKLRTGKDSMFDFQKCEACLDACAPFVKEPGIVGI